MNETRFSLELADRCVKCGLCLPHCPTYAETRHEGDSPRGRIALMQGLATGSLAPTPSAQAHLDGCLTCRACEPVCPAHVPYGQLIDEGRAMLAAARPGRTRLTRLLAAALTRKPARAAIALLLWIYQRSGLQALARRSRVLGRGRLARLESYVPRVSLRRLPRSAGARQAPARGRVALFTNCVSPLAEHDVLHDSVRLLTHAGYDVHVVPAQTCCGALHRHAGLGREASVDAARNVSALAGYDWIVSVASGCTAQLLEYRLLVPDGAAFSARVKDIHQLLAPHADALAFRPLKARCAVHAPCTLRNVVRGTAAVETLLRRIPELELVNLDPGETCCGAAGSYFLAEPAMADRLLDRKVSAAQALQPEFIVSANVGCTLHLASGLRRTGAELPVLHPVTLLARQLVG